MQKLDEILNYNYCSGEPESTELRKVELAESEQAKAALLEAGKKLPGDTSEDRNRRRSRERKDRLRMALGL